MMHGGRGFFNPADEDDLARGSVGRETWARVVELFRPYRRQVVVVALLILFTSGVGVVNPLLIRTVFDTAIFVKGGPNLPRLYVLVAIMAAVPIITGAIGIAQTYYTNLVGQNVMRDLRGRLYAHLQSLPLRFFTATKTGEIQSRLANDVGGVQTVLTTTASSILSSVVTFISSLIAMIIISVPLTVVSVITVPIFFYLTRAVGERRRTVATSTQRAMADMSAMAEETLSVSGVLLSKVFGRQAEEALRYRSTNQRLANLEIRQQMIGQTFFAFVQAFLSITPAAIYLIAGILLAHGNHSVSPGTIVAFTTLQTRLYFPIGQLLQVSVELRTSLALFDRVFEYLDIHPDITDAPDAFDLDPSSLQGEVRFNQVSFSYGLDQTIDQDKPGTLGSTEPQHSGGAGADWALAPRKALDRINLVALPGQLVALVGPSGAGKTTISYLVPRLYDVTEGSITIDGIDIRRVTQASLASSIGFVTQESYLFHASIADNLLYGRPEASAEEMMDAAKAAFIHDRIMEFPAGYDTMVGERGYRLSGGEKQRLAIARVLLHAPRILLLDEATSALDTASERMVQRALEPLVSGRTTIAIAHRLSTIVAADVIYVIDRGEVREKGTHQELLAKGGLYFDLYEEQFDGGKVESHCADGLILADGSVSS